MKLSRLIKTAWAALAIALVAVTALFMTDSGSDAHASSALTPTLGADAATKSCPKKWRHERIELNVSGRISRQGPGIQLKTTKVDCDAWSGTHNPSQFAQLGPATELNTTGKLDRQSGRRDLFWRMTFLTAGGEQIYSSLMTITNWKSKSGYLGVYLCKMRGGVCVKTSDTESTKCGANSCIEHMKAVKVPAKGGYGPYVVNIENIYARDKKLQFSKLSLACQSAAPGAVCVPPAT